MKFTDDENVPGFPYPELRTVLSIFVEQVSAQLKANLVGIYLVGSLASGDFDLDSDIDFLVVIYKDLSTTDMQALQDIQFRIHEMDCYPAKHLEGSYITITDLNDWGTVGDKKLYYFEHGDTSYQMSTHDNKWHVRWVLRERGVTLVGTKPDRLLPSIPPDELANEIKITMIELKEIFEQAIDQPLSFMNSRFGQSFFVLTYCRMLHTLHTGTVQSKKAAMTWAMQVLDPEWRDLIDQAWNERQGVRFSVKIRQLAKLALLNETLGFINYAIGQIDKISKY